MRTKRTHNKDTNTWGGAFKSFAHDWAGSGKQFAGDWAETGGTVSRQLLTGNYKKEQGEKKKHSPHRQSRRFK